jgi:hypothetical protein
MKSAWLLSFALCALVLPLSTRAANGDLMPHHAIYKLILDRSPNGMVVSATGQMDYQLSDACEAWATAQRLDMNVTYNDGTTTHMVSDYVTWEQKDGSLLRFRMHQTSDQKVTADLAGDAIRRPNGTGSINYTEPADKQVDLPAGTLFPMAQTVAFLEAAGKGQKFLTAPLFDGTGGNGAEDSFTVMGNFAPLKTTQPANPRLSASLLQVPSGRVTISFFDRQSTTEVPDYDVAM